MNLSILEDLLNQDSKAVNESSLPLGQEESKDISKLDAPANKETLNAFKNHYKEK
jgi:hypothetical protein